MKMFNEMKKQVGKLNPILRKPEPPVPEKAPKKKKKKQEVRTEKKEATTVITKK